MTGSVLDIVAAVLVLLFVRRLTADQNARAMAGNPSPEPQYPTAGGPVPGV